uniref:C-type lectin domain-containing protein n=1 Tax=Astyanax mexicanus TaxID=7994 RepID=A0A8B9LTJ0_ASTMX
MLKKWVHLVCIHVHILILKTSLSYSIFIFTNSLSLSALGDCEAGWRPYQDRCYYFSSDTKTWHDALTECQSKNANLMSISDIHERTNCFYNQLFLLQETHQNLHHPMTVCDFLFYYKKYSITYYKVRKYVTFTYWAPGEPNNHLGFNEDCVEMYQGNGSSYWNDIFCDAHQDWVCMIAKGKTPTEPPVPPSAIPGNTY